MRELRNNWEKYGSKELWLNSITITFAWRDQGKQKTS
jgi:hypothetical protein